MHCCHNVHLEKSTAKILIGLGFRADLRGYEYMRCAVIEAYHSPESSRYVTKSLFPKVARLCGRTTVASVARGCRHAIERAFDFGQLRHFLELSGADAYPPSSLVIEKIAHHLHSYG